MQVADKSRALKGAKSYQPDNPELNQPLTTTCFKDAPVKPCHLS